MRRRCVSQRDRKIYGLDADMPQRIFCVPAQPKRRFSTLLATETAVSVVCHRRAGHRGALKSGLLIPLDVQSLRLTIAKAQLTAFGGKI
jgi:hypothetical protein